jgi:hypothetical protein
LSSSCVYPKRTRSRRSAASSIAGATGSGISKRQDATVAEIGARSAGRARNARVDQLARGEAHRDALAGSEPAAFDDRIVAEIDDAGLRRREHLAGLGAAPAHRPKAAAVERRADAIAVGENDRRRPVPRLDGRDVRVVVRAQPLVVVDGGASIRSTASSTR